MRGGAIGGGGFFGLIKTLRIENGLTQKALSENLSMSERAMRHYEAGTREPEHKALIALADYFNVSLDWLVGRSEVRERR
jgi:transcriptional regulator with XRE-family HTH domain